MYVLQIDHNADVANAYCQAFREKLVFRNFNATFAPHQLTKAVNNNAACVYVDNIIARSAFTYISAAGHGEYDQLLGEDGVPIWESHPITGATPSMQFLSGKIIHLLSCDTGSYLGHMMVDSGVTCFWGYNTIFLWPRSPRSQIDRIEDDQISEPFFEMDAIIDRGILQGDSSQTIYKNICTYVRNTVVKIPSRHRLMFLDNFMILACPALHWGNPLITV
jgi:hypothetical protein